MRNVMMTAAFGAAASTGVELRVSPAVTSSAATLGPRREAMNDMRIPPSVDAGTYNPVPSSRVARAKGWSPDCDSPVGGT